MSAGLIHLFNGREETLAGPVQSAVLQQGLALRLHHHVAGLCDSVSRPPAANENRLVVLLGAQGSCSTLARAVRRVDPHIGMVALLPAVTQRQLEWAMHYGIDACWHAGASAQLIGAALRRQLQRGSLKGASVTPTPADLYEPGWRLGMRGWVVHAPNAAGITLTTAEREIILALWQAPQHWLSHDALLKVVDRLSGGAGSPASLRRLSVLVSRLRKKFQAAGVPVPISSVRGSGYELSVDLQGAPPSGDSGFARSAAIRR